MLQSVGNRRSVESEVRKYKDLRQNFGARCLDEVHMCRNNN